LQFEASLGQIVCKTLSQKTLHKNRAQGEDPEFKPHYRKKKRMSNLLGTNWWFMPVILASQEANIRRIVV
jgi:hypothetical protein